MKRVACGMTHTLCCDTYGRVYSWGENSDGRLGLDDTEDRFAPTLVACGALAPRGAAARAAAKGSVRPAEAVVDVACGWHHSLLITAQGRLLACGEGDKGQLGVRHPDGVFRFEPVEVLAELGARVVSADGGKEHTVAVVRVSGDATDSGQPYHGMASPGKEHTAEQLAKPLLPRRYFYGAVEHQNEGVLPGAKLMPHKSPMQQERTNPLQSKRRG